MMDLFRLMMCSQMSFVENRITDEKYARIFKDTSIKIVNLTTENNDIDKFKLELEKTKQELQKEKPGLLTSLFNDNYRYKVIAIELAEDILASINNRFISGGSKAYLELFPKRDFIC